MNLNFPVKQLERMFGLVELPGCLKDSFHGNYVTSYDCRVYSTFEPNRNRLGELIAGKPKPSILHTKVILGLG